MFYEVFKESFFDEQLGSYESYGIRCEKIFEIKDVTLNFQSITKLVDELNINQVELASVSDIIEDFICEEECYIFNDVKRSCDS